MWSTITDCFSETREYREFPSPRTIFPPLLCLRRTCVQRVCNACGTSHLLRLMTRVRAWRMIIKVSQVSRFVSTLSQLLSSFLPRHETGRVCFVPVSTIYSQSSKTPVPPHDSIDQPAHGGIRCLFHSILYCHGNARLHLFVRLSVTQWKARLIAAMSQIVSPLPLPVRVIGYSSLFKEVIGSTVDREKPNRTVTRIS